MEPGVTFRERVDVVVFATSSRASGSYVGTARTVSADVRRPKLRILGAIHIHDALLKIGDNINVASYTANISMGVIREVFEGRVISKELWIIRVSDISNCNFYVWGNMKELV
jgi:hypothetical protein